MDRYVVITEIERTVLDHMNEYWQDRTEIKTELKVFDSFTEAVRGMRQVIQQLAGEKYGLQIQRLKSAFCSPAADPGDIDPEIRKADRFRQELIRMMEDPSYQFGLEYVTRFHWEDDFISIWFAYEGDACIDVTADRFLICNSRNLWRTNCTDMSDPSRTYFFGFEKKDRSGSPERSVRVCLLREGPPQIV